MKEVQESQLNLGALGPLPNPFHLKVKKFSDDEPVEPSPKPSRVRLDKATGYVIPQSSSLNYHISSISGALKGVGWSERELVAFSYSAGTFNSLFSHPIYDIYHGRWLDTNTIAIAFEDRCELYRIVTVDTNGDEVCSPAFVDPILTHFSKSIRCC
ncbi:hypothetical protein BDP27DRAFT_554582 [Rhodocollybia butyracea]|uniref:Uncharacterized protein n=1 Tax=Rhodocollybia butyracea TaxID=206335 RepID=A0A9P5PXC8_9AGAR|nr:hypothetical protein BDP27DRAFT_554582 [Rhodocollybia butyracea]